jgi:hypothetical protein
MVSPLAAIASTTTFDDSAVTVPAGIVAVSVLPTARTVAPEEG